MSILTNYLLFNHTYLKDLTSDTSIDPEIPFSPRDLGDWYNAQITTSIKSLVDSWVQSMLSLLELEIHSLDSEDEHAFSLTTAYDQDTPIGICYVAPPSADLDTTTKGRFWMAQAVLTARRHEPALRWVILTNGDLWRLLDAQALRRYEAYIQIDVGQLAQGASDPSAMRVFFRCFHRSGFEQDGDGKSGIENLLEASDHATEKAEKHLNELVSGTDGIMAQLCLGLVRSTGKSKFSEEERDAIYRDATALLYRMLFLLYAESRDLLPNDNPRYAEVSMANLVEKARAGQQRGLDRPQATDLWERLKRLSNAIYESDPDLAIPAYNGGLFDDDDHPYLRDGYIADQFLSRALYDFAFLPNDNGLQAIDYRDLSVRHLGSLYEGMIEYKLFVAEEPMLARRDKKGNIHFLTQKDAEGLRRNDQEIKDGEVYFAQNSGERRATGTYYTPEYIVNYIVRNTVVRGLEERRASLERKLEKWLKEISTANPDEQFKLQRIVDDDLLDFIKEKVLTFTVCDPAMGSGHFLVNASHNFANFIIETLYLTTWDNQGLNTNPAYWRRRIAERCLFGVDISEMAVELAKLSLWLATMAKGKPLSFLRHHLIVGNSLLGARLEDLGALRDDVMQSTPSRKEKQLLDSGQLSMLENPVFSQHLKSAEMYLNKITSRVVESIADIKDQETNYERVRKELETYRVLADVAVGKYFGLEITKTELNRLSSYVFKGLEPQEAQKKSLLKTTCISRNRTFIHWDIEFPQPLIVDKGFNAIIGNPPYVRQEQLKSEKLYFQESYETYSGGTDLYVYFIERGLSLLRSNGYFGFIISNKFLRANYGESLRNLLLTQTKIFKLVDFGELPVFPEVGTFPLILLFEKIAITKQIFQVSKIKSLDFVDFSSEVTDKSYLVTNDVLGIKGWSLANRSVTEILNKLINLSIPLSEYVNKEIYSGLKTGLNEAFFIDADTYNRIINSNEKYKEIVKPLIVGDDVRHYEIEGRNRYIISIPNGWTNRSLKTNTEAEAWEWFSTSYPYIAQHLLSFSEKAITRWDKGEYWWELRPCGYYEKIELPKIVYPDISKESRFALDINNNYYPANTLYFIPRKDYYLLALLNSKLIFFYMRNNSSVLGDPEGTGRLRFTYQYVENIPIKIIFTSMETEVEPRGFLRINEDYYHDYLITNDYFPILEFVDNNLNSGKNNSGNTYDLLSMLSWHMVELNNEKQSQMKSFLKWLENQLGASIDDLSGKTYLTNFLGDYQKFENHLNLNKLIEILAKNKRKFAVDPNERGIQRSLEKHYQESLDVLLPIKKRLAMTDQLIDQIVYRLYGLTEEEIRIVEGN